MQTSFALVLAHTEPIEKLRPYVFTVIGREVGHAARRCYTGRGYGSLDADVQLEDVQMEGAATDPCGAVEVRLDVETALQSLPLQQRRAVLYNKALGLTQAQTATAMRTAPGTVATHVARAVVTLRVTLSTLALVLIAGGAFWLRGEGKTIIIPAAGFERLGVADTRLAIIFALGVAGAGIGFYVHLRASPDNEVRAPWQSLSDLLRALKPSTSDRRGQDLSSSSADTFEVVGSVAVRTFAAASPEDLKDS
ncbi:sigma-70 family RNA polymerase sigma factor [Streptomyces sp. NPDC048564]|uniref:sigma-70 family RNA polymerase sigma factor n=1 Tax=Streptomyces sp. NPDC048564 TaxID=3155760 RepID=UPI00344AC896